MLLYCRPFEEEIMKRLKALPRPTKGLSAVLIGNDPASSSFLKQKERVAHDLGIKFSILRIDEGEPEAHIQGKIGALATDASIGGIILQLPVPALYSRSALIRAIPKEKDIDALREDSSVLPPAVEALKEVLVFLRYDLSSGRVIVVGKGFLVGAPITSWLLKEGAEVIAMDKESFNPALLSTGDLIISGTGVAGLIRGEHIRAGATCIDFGYGRNNGKLSGDFDAETVAPKARYLTPVPGGMGPLLVLELFKNFFTLTQGK
jgi:methylenetetrahydrofolate dehydrogenase (NADP+)/methenyltetrahydrofolate cyclohydrolase